MVNRMLKKKRIKKKQNPWVDKRTEWVVKQMLSYHKKKQSEKKKDII